MVYYLLLYVTPVPVSPIDVCSGRFHISVYFSLSLSRNDYNNNNAQSSAEVYQGMMKLHKGGEQQHVAIKRMAPEALQGLQNFQREARVTFLSLFRTALHCTETYIRL